ncbi:hypothetical protein Q1695_006602 [Nippostrongylus brasiliensis]|nr:hypothetical protein Q1695_006602 [Nippostrongylus brasiliensis]
MSPSYVRFHANAQGVEDMSSPVISLSELNQDYGTIEAKNDDDATRGDNIEKMKDHKDTSAKSSVDSAHRHVASGRIHREAPGIDG